MSTSVSSSLTSNYISLRPPPGSSGQRQPSVATVPQLQTKDGATQLDPTRSN